MEGGRRRGNGKGELGRVARKLDTEEETEPEEIEEAEAQVDDDAEDDDVDGGANEDAEEAEPWNAAFFSPLSVSTM